MYSVFFTLVLLFWSSEIGPELKPFIQEDDKKVRKPIHSPKKLVSDSPKAGGIKRPMLKAGPQSYFNEEQFRFSFLRQSPQRLIPCLKNWQSSPQSIWVKGTLNRKGKMSGLVSIDAGVIMPPCLHEAIGEMSFSSVVSGMTVESTNIHWRIDW